MDLGSIEYNDRDNYGFRTTSLVLAFQPAAVRVIDKAGGVFSNEEAHYEPSADSTVITVGDNGYIGQYGGKASREITVPLSYDDVKRLLREGAKNGEIVDLTDEKLPLLRASLKRGAEGHKFSL